MSIPGITTMLLLSCLLSVHPLWAFTTPLKLSQRYRPTTNVVVLGKPSHRSHNIEDIPLNSIEDVETAIENPQEDPLSSVSAYLPLAADATATADDLGKAIFLEKIEENKQVIKTLQEASLLDNDIVRSDRNTTVAVTLSPPFRMDTAATSAQQEASSTTTINKGIEPSVATTTTILEEQDDVTAVLGFSQDAAEEVTTVAPTVRKIFQFAIPAIGVWLCGPLLSMIDTAAVGLFAGTVQQAALNPAVAVTDYAALLIAFLYTGTTNLVATAWEQDKHKTSNRTAETLLGVMRLSLVVGAGLGSVLFFGAPTMVRAIMGGEASSPAVFKAAIDYVRIRALGMPAAALIGSTQAACLGMQDIKSPLYVLVAAAVVNFVFDMAAVGSMGAAGAAAATVASQVTGAALFVFWLRHKRPVVNVSKAILDMNSDTLSKAMHKKPKQKSFSVRGFLHGQLRLLDLFKLPNRKTLRQFSEYVVPVTSAQVGRVSGYVAMSHVVSSTLGTISMAAQSIIVSLFYCLTPIADSLSLTAQSFVPSIFEKKPSVQRSQALRKTIVNFMKAGGIFGAIMVAAVGCIPLVSGAFTSDLSVIALVNKVTPMLAGVFAVHGVVCASEGLLLGQKDLGFLGKLYTAFSFVVPYYMLRIKTVAGASLTSVWRVFLSYQLIRCASWLFRVIALQRNAEKRLVET